MDKDEAIEEAWKLAIEAIQSGKVTLSSGKVVVLSERDMLRHVQWLALVNKARAQGFPILKDIHVKATAKNKGKE